MCCAPSVCNGGLNVGRSMEGGWWDGSRDGDVDDDDDSRAWKAGREDGTCVCQLHLSRRIASSMVFPSSPHSSKRPGPARCITPGPV